MIELINVSKKYGHDIAVADVSLTIPDKEITVLLGRSGSGKTTLLRMVNRMVDPSSGHVEIDGENILDKDPVELRRSIGYVMQHGGLMPHKSVLDNVITVLLLNGVKKDEAVSRANDMLDSVGLGSDMGSRWPSELSGGQRQRVGVARALVHDPKIILMDEPFGALDPLVRTDLQHLLVELCSGSSRTVLFVTHDVDEALLLADTLVLLEDKGKVVQVGRPDDVLLAPKNEFVSSFLGLSNGHRSFRVREDNIVLDGKGHIRGAITDE